jgi:hypothetical protein
VPCILPYPLLFYSLLFLPIFYPILSYPILSYPILSCLLLAPADHFSPFLSFSTYPSSSPILTLLTSLLLSSSVTPSPPFFHPLLSQHRNYYLSSLFSTNPTSSISSPLLSSCLPLHFMYYQSDTMSYLILPILLEGGMFLTARQQHRSVCNFHNSAKVCV